MQAGDVILDRYHVLAPLGRGGMGVVWRAKDVVEDRDVAIKTLHGVSEPADRQRFQREAVALIRMDHPNCVAVHDFGTAEAGPFLVLELVDGTPLARMRGQQLPVEQVRTIGLGIARALSFAHRGGITHRDLKPENVIITSSGQPKVIDFGIAKIMDVHLPDITKTGELLGTPSYMSPEQLRGARDAGPASDQYALGVMLFEMLEGRNPFDGDTMLAVAFAHLKNPAPPVQRPDCPPQLRDVVARLLSKQPSQRFATTDELVRALEGTKGAAAPRNLSNRRLFALAAVLIAVVVFVAAVVQSLSEPEPRVIAAAAPPPAARQALMLDDEPELEPAPPEPAPSSTQEPAWKQNPAAPDGCGRGDGAGQIDLSGLRYVPTTYSPSRRSPVLLYLTGGYVEPPHALEATGFYDLAEERGLVIVAPHLALANAIGADNPAKRMRDFIERQTTDLCVDRDNVIVVGQNHRARVAEQATCAPWMRALVFHGHDRADFKPLTKCPDDRVIPTLALWPMKTRRMPALGGPSECDEANDVVSVDVADDRRLEKHGCTGEQTPRDVTDGTCVEHDCAVPYTSCRVNGGLAWPGTSNPRVVLRCGYEMNSKFPAVDVIHDFIEKLPPVD